MKELSVRTKYLMVAGCMVALQALDGVVTTMVVSTAWARETNPLLIGVADQSWFWLAKLLLTAAVLGVMYWRLNKDERHFPRATKWLAVASVVYIGIVAWNSYCLYVLQSIGVFT